MTNTPSDAEIDEVTLDVLGYAALDKETNDTARMIARAVLAKWGTPPVSQEDAVAEVVIEPDYWSRGHFYEGKRKTIRTLMSLESLPTGTRLVPENAASSQAKATSET